MLVIRNKGEIELGALTLLGATTKEGDNSKIGFFGSGNKYAIATLLRKGIVFEIYSGTRRLEIGTQPVQFGGMEYQQIYIDNKPTSFSTRMGPQWETWFAIREFICNAMDEGGFELKTGDPQPEEGITTIAIELTDEVQEFYLNISNYILFSREPIDKMENKVAVYMRAQESMGIYRRGISVRGGYEAESLYDYDFYELGINESRTFIYEHQLRYALAEYFAQCTEFPILHSFLYSTNENLFEKDLRWYNVKAFSSTWKEVVGNKTLTPNSYSSHIPHEDKSDLLFIQDDLFKKLRELKPELSYYGDEAGWLEQEDEEYRLEINQALKELKELNFDLEWDLPIKIGKFTRHGVMAMFQDQLRIICMSAEYKKDLRETKLTLLEEFLHAKGYKDGSRSLEYFLMQQWLDSKEKLFNIKHKLESIIDEE